MLNPHCLRHHDPAMMSQATNAGTLRMTKQFSQTSAACLIACLMGCSDGDPPVASAATPTQPRVVGVNGTYNGLMQLTSGSAVACGSSDIFSVVVQNNAFRFVLNQPQVPWQPQRVFATTIAPDGSFLAGTDAAYIRGTASNGRMQGQIVGDACQFQFEANSDGTF
jgi:hypothetical protein